MHKLHEPTAKLADALIKDHVVSRIWDRDISAWKANPGTPDAASIATRLGWLDVARTMAPDIERAAALGNAVKAEGVEAVYLLGMGGSSLCAEVLRTSHAASGKDRDGWPELHVLDTTDEQALTSVAARMAPEHTRLLPEFSV